MKLSASLICLLYEGHEEQYEQDTSSKSFSVSPSWTRSSISKSLRSSPLFVPAFCRGLWLPLPARRPAPREVGGWTRRGATRKEGPHVLALQPGHRRRRLWCTPLFFLLPLHRRRRPQQPPASPRRLHVYCSIHGGCPILGGGCATSLSHGYHELRKFRCALVGKQRGQRRRYAPALWRLSPGAPASAVGETEVPGIKGDGPLGSALI